MDFWGKAGCGEECFMVCANVFFSLDLISATNETNVNIPQMADTLFERAMNASWVVVFKALVTTHHMCIHGNEVSGYGRRGRQDFFWAFEYLIGEELHNKPEQPISSVCFVCIVLHCLDNWRQCVYGSVLIITEVYPVPGLQEFTLQPEQFYRQNRYPRWVSVHRHILINLLYDLSQQLIEMAFHLCFG